MKYVFVLFVLLFSAPAFAEESCNRLNVKVTGLVCDFCARSIEKTFGKRDEVEKVHVDLDTGDIHLTLKPGKTLDEVVVKELITDAGYTFVSTEKGC